jgi:ketosteroid isomerase-like protein
MHVRSLLIASSLFLSTLFVGPALAQSTPAASAQAQPAAQNEATQVVDGFMAALINNQLEVARQAMTPEAVVIANGTVLGTRDGYIDGAAKADAVAMKSVRSRELLHRDSQVGAQIGWVVSEKRMVGDAAGQMRALVLTETFLLTKTAAGWKISGIHWSSRAAS